MSEQAEQDQPSMLRTRARRVARRVPGLYAVCRLVLETLRQCMRYRVTGLASEAGFFALLSFPPLVYGLLGVMGYVGGALGGRTVDDIVRSIERYLEGILSGEALQNVVMPTLHDALEGGRPDVVSIGFLLSLWSGSRMINVIVDTISIMYGQGGVRGIVRARALSVTLYFVSLLFIGAVLPLIVIGPDLLGRMLPPGLLFLLTLYWPVVGAITIVGFATLYYIATPVRTPWVRDLPGAGFTLIAWVIISLFLRSWLSASVGGISIYGPLAAAIIALIWLYSLSIAVLIGAALNSAVARLWPVAAAPVGVRARTRGLIEEQVAKVRSRAGDDAPYDQENETSAGARHGRPYGERAAVVDRGARPDGGVVTQGEAAAESARPDDVAQRRSA
ncbi:MULTISPECIES: YihY/virulence factor BrkB family protein [Dermacoccus]|uniref:YihY/virulence factor BrkB family protein n=1 Tax=Dermacoccus TaxID=57495 RepID=UPI00093B74CB|nr:YihY/virulence factor BrkB family protein [Dermacoccus nishinomiyaensis]MBO1757765.1 YihY/virulence factor BrkB family protein [Dermacoccus sp. NHGro5]PZO99754.1 MAG: YihY/virulence factor BrkB family protein [Dermacoccus nishinomiyaensis]